MTGRYDFTIHRCAHCGTAVSIDDTEPCCNPKEIRMEKDRIVRRTLDRLLRRSYAHGQEPWLVKVEDSQAIVIFAGRTAKIRDDGSIVQDMHPRHMPDGTRRADPCWKSYKERLHANDMAWAARCRRSRWIWAAREAIASARNTREAFAND